MTINETLLKVSEYFQASGMQDAQFEARELLKCALNLSTAELITSVRELDSADEKKIKEWAEKRKQGMPLAYLAKEKGFFKHLFHVDTGVLVPRPETELVVEVALRRAALADYPIERMADLGAGSGCIGLCLLFELTRAELWSVENSPKACSIVLKNSRTMGLEEKTHIDCIAVESWDPETDFDLIVANPPYIPVGDARVQASVHQHEPHAALYSGTDGLEAIRKWVPVVRRFLKPGGIAVFEIGAGQSEAVREIMVAAGLKDVEACRDLAGIERVISARG